MNADTDILSTPFKTYNGVDYNCSETEECSKLQLHSNSIEMYFVKGGYNTVVYLEDDGTVTSLDVFNSSVILDTDIEMSQYAYELFTFLYEQIQVIPVGPYYWAENPNLGEVYSMISVQFTSNNSSYQNMYLHDDDGAYKLRYTTTSGTEQIVYTSSGWTNDAYKNFTLTKSFNVSRTTADKYFIDGHIVSAYERT